MKTAIYARVSTLDQNCEMQLRELREYVTRRGWELAGEYIDTGWSGAKASRPELDRLMHDAALHQFDIALVWKLDRFGRSVRNCLNGIESLRAHGVRFLAVSQSIDTDESNPTAKLLLHILASVAEFERELIRERVRAGIKSAKHKGKQLGRKRVVFDRDKAHALHESGASLREIAAALQVGKGTIQRLLDQKPTASATSQPIEKLVFDLSITAGPHSTVSGPEIGG
jgi:putative DNA-invertase from lambdoid prophage Rac